MKAIISMALAAMMMVGCTPAVVNTEDKTVVDNKEVIVEAALSEDITNSNYEVYVDLSNIKKDIESLSKKYKGVFDRYVQYMAPNGKAINIVAQANVSNEQLLKAYNVLSFYLSSHKSYDMDSVANKMADNEMILMMPNGADGDVELKESVFTGQPLYKDEVPVTGDGWYMNNNYEHRDASYEEILHLVHDGGIGTIVEEGALPTLQKSIEAAMRNALPSDKKDWGKKGLWGLKSRNWLVELSKEGSLEQEYLVSVVDSYYGLWEAFDENDGGMWGLYVAKNREAIAAKDPQGLEVLESFLPEYFTYMDRIDPSFEGTFSMTLDKEKPYTYKSQYILNARLTGALNSNLEGNAKDNILIGNAGNNTIDGKDGIDIVQFSGLSSDYEITNGIVKDLKGLDGTDTLKNIEIMRFKDKDIEIVKQ